MPVELDFCLSQRLTLKAISLSSGFVSSICGLAQSYKHHIELMSCRL